MLNDDLDLATADFKHQLQKVPHNQTAWFLLIKALFKSGRYDEAVRGETISYLKTQYLNEGVCEYAIIHGMGGGDNIKKYEGTMRKYEEKMEKYEETFSRIPRIRENGSWVPIPPIVGKADPKIPSLRLRGTNLFLGDGYFPEQVKGSRFEEKVLWISIQRYFFGGLPDLPGRASRGRGHNS